MYRWTEPWFNNGFLSVNTKSFPSNHKSIKVLSTKRCYNEQRTLEYIKTVSKGQATNKWINWHPWMSNCLFQLAHLLQSKWLPAKNLTVKNMSKEKRLDVESKPYPKFRAIWNEFLSGICWFTTSWHQQWFGNAFIRPNVHPGACQTESCHVLESGCSSLRHNLVAMVPRKKTAQ